jgi:hypothetical protein
MIYRLVVQNIENQDGRAKRTAKNRCRVHQPASTRSSIGDSFCPRCTKVKMLFSFRFTPISAIQPASSSRELAESPVARCSCRCQEPGCSLGSIAGERLAGLLVLSPCR